MGAPVRASRLRPARGSLSLEPVKRLLSKVPDQRRVSHLPLRPLQGLTMKGTTGALAPTVPTILATG